MKTNLSLALSLVLATAMIGQAQAHGAALAQAKPIGLLATAINLTPPDAVTLPLQSGATPVASGNARQLEAGIANTACSIFIYGLTFGLGTDINYKFCGV